MLFTIGYEGATLAEFTATLTDVGVDFLVDIRDRPQSRRPGFSKSALAGSMLAAGIDYMHIGNLGDPKPGRDAARSGDYATFRKIYENVLRTPLAEAAVENLACLAKDQNVCLLCYERNPQECHRKMVAQAIERITNEGAVHLGVRSPEQIARASGRVRYPRESITA